MYALQADAVFMGSNNGGGDLHRPSKRDGSMSEAPRCRNTRDSSESAAQTREIPSCSPVATTSTIGSNRTSLRLFGVRWFERQISSRFRVVSQELILPVVGMFVFYVCHDALQEKMFRFEGFKFGWFMTLTEVVVMIFGALASEGVALQMPPGGRQTWAITAIIGLCVSLSHGCGNTALRFSSYPLKVAFKSCKLVPTMAVGFFINGRRHSLSAYFAALVMCMGLFLLSISDAATPKSILDASKMNAHQLFLKSFVGPLLLLFSTSMDSVVPNLQEHLFQKTNMRTVDMIFLSNIFMVMILFLSTVTSGELRQAVVYCRSNPRVLAVLTLQSACAYGGLRCYLTVIKKLGGAAGVLLANARKIVTILLSFILFRKPCRAGHVAGLCLIFAGVYLGLVNKKSRKKKDTATDKSDAQDKHDHNV